MADTITINDQELAILCDLMAGWGAKWSGNLNAAKRALLDQLITKGFIEPADQHSVFRYQNTRKAELLLAELCVGVSSG